IPYTIHLKDKEDGSLKNGDIDSTLVNVSLKWLKGNYTVEPSSNGIGQLKSQGEKLIGESDCRSCHKVNERAIGPSFMEIAKRYEGEEGAIDYIAEKIISGGSGVWGEISMSAHPMFSEEDTRRMADYILSLATENKNIKKWGLRVPSAYRLQICPKIGLLSLKPPTPIREPLEWNLLQYPKCACFNHQSWKLKTILHNVTY